MGVRRRSIQEGGAEKNRYLPFPVCDAFEKWGGFLQAAIHDNINDIPENEECLWNSRELETSKEREVNDRQHSETLSDTCGVK